MHSATAYMRQLLVAAFCFIALQSGSNAADMCSNAAGQGDQAVREQYQSTIDWYLKLASAAKFKGFDPRNFPQADSNGNITSVDLIALLDAITAKRDEAISTIYAEYQDCEQNVRPYQDIADTTSFFLTGGLSSVIPDQATHIDASQLLSGTPFGGPGAIVLQAREQMFSLLGIGGDAANLIRNPLQVLPSGLVRSAWAPILGTGLPFTVPISPPLLPQNIPLPQLPSIPAPPPIPLGTVGGHRVCLPWC